MCPPEKSQAFTAFTSEQSDLRDPVCLGMIAKYGHFLRISEEEEPTFSVSQTVWRSAQSGANFSPREFPANREKYREFAKF
jgi:hypothetical protein